MVVAEHSTGRAAAPARESMRLEAVVGRVKRVCDAGLDSIALRRKAAALLAPVLALDAHVFCTCDPETGLISHAVAAGVAGDVARGWAERLGPVAEEGVLGSDAQLHVALEAGGRVWGSWWLLRAPVEGARARALLARIAPHLARGLRAAALAECGGSASLAPADAEPGVLVLDVRGHVMMRTPSAAAWLADLADDGLRMPDGLPLAVPALVAEARRAAAGGRGAVRLRARGRTGRWYLLRASLAEHHDGDERPAVVVIRPVNAHEAATIRTRSYGLSMREREVIAALVRGASTKEIAAALGRSPYTVQEHIERACRKIGVQGRKALVAKLFLDGQAPGFGEEVDRRTAFAPPTLARASAIS